MKKNRLIICLLIILILTGCGKNINKVPYNEFEGIIGKYKYVLNNTTSNYNYAEEAYAYVDNDAHFEYIETTKVNEAKGMYMDDFTNIYNAVADNNKGKIDNENSWSTFLVKTDERCYFIFLYDKTYIYVEMSKEKEKEFDDIVDKITS